MRSATTVLVLGLGLSAMSCSSERNALFVHLSNVPSRTATMTVNATLDGKPATTGLDLPPMLGQFAVRFDEAAAGHAKLTIEALDTDRCTIGNSVTEYDLPSDFLDLTLGMNAVGPRKCGSLPACAANNLCAVTKPASITSTIESVFAFAPNDIWAAGLNTTLLHYDGTAWSAVPPPAGVPSTIGYYGMWGSAPNDIWVVGSAGSMAHYDGSKWTDVPGVTTSTLYGVWGVSKTRIWAVGDYNSVSSQSTILQYDGSNWMPLFNPGLDRLNGVWADQTGTSTLAYACGNNGALMRYDSDKAANWVNIMPVTTAHLHGIWGTPQRTIFAVGDGGVIARVLYPSPSASWGLLPKAGVNNLLAVRGDGSQVVYAVGSMSTVARADSPYDSFTLLNGGAGATTLLGIGLASNGLIWTGGSGGFLGIVDMRP